MSIDSADARLLRGAYQVARQLRDLAERIEDASSRGDLERLAEVSHAPGVWTVDAIRGAALALIEAGLK